MISPVDSKSVTNRNRGNRNPKRCGQISPIENLAMTARQECEKTPKGHQIAHIRDGPDIAFEVGLEVRREPELAGPGARKNLWKSTVQETLLSRFFETKRPQLKDSGAPAIDSVIPRIKGDSCEPVNSHSPIRWGRASIRVRT